MFTSSSTKTINQNLKDDKDDEDSLEDGLAFPDNTNREHETVNESLEDGEAPDELPTNSIVPEKANNAISSLFHRPEKEVQLPNEDRTDEKNTVVDKHSENRSYKSSSPRSSEHKKRESRKDRNEELEDRKHHHKHRSKDKRHKNEHRFEEGQPTLYSDSSDSVLMTDGSDQQPQIKSTEHRKRRSHQSKFHHLSDYKKRESSEDRNEGPEDRKHHHKRKHSSEDHDDRDRSHKRHKNEHHSDAVEEQDILQKQPSRYSDSVLMTEDEYRETQRLQTNSRHQQGIDSVRPQKFTGEFRGNYERLYQDMSYCSPDEDYNTLGKISSKPGHYFLSGQCENLAMFFLEAFWSDPTNYQLTIDNHQNKFNNQNSNFRKNALFPSCISFTLVKIKNTKICLVSLSGYDQMIPALKDALKTFVINYDKSHKNYNIDYSLLQGDSSNFHILVGSSSNNPFHKKICSEKTYGSVLTKLYSKYGNDMTVMGNVNCSFYPYQKEVVYGDKAQTEINSRVQPPLLYASKVLILRNKNNQHSLTFKPCCTDCKNNKNNMLRIWKTAQRKSTKSQEKKQDFIITSPLHDNFATSTVLIPESSDNTNSNGDKSTDRKTLDKKFKS